MIKIAFITIPDKSTSDQLTASEFNQILDALKDATLDINTAELFADGIKFELKVSDPVTPTEGELWYNTTDNKLRYYDGTSTITISTAGTGDVIGPASSTDDRLATFDGTTGKLIQDGGSTVSDVLNRSNHTGTQTASTISDFDTEVSNNSSVTANTAKVGVTTQISNVSEDSTPELGGDLDCNDNDIIEIRTAGFNDVLASGSKTASFDVDFDDSQTVSVTLTANTMTATLQTPITGQSDATRTLIITNGGLATLTWSASSGSVNWPGGTAPTLTSSGTDIIVFKWNGTNWYGIASLDFS